jgi:signal transduction histidine kinase
MSSNSSKRTTAAVEDSEALVKEMTTGIRTISYLLHPPLLDEAGLTSPLRCYVEGLAAGSEIRVDLEVPGNFDRLPKDLETAVFRVVLECLTNVHRHSGSPVAKIRLSRSADDVQLGTTGFLFQTANGTMLDPRNIDRDSLSPILEEMGRDEVGTRFNVFRRFREAVLQRSEARQILIDY